MWKDGIIVGKDYALREKRRPGVPFQRVKIIEHVRGSKWRVEWVDPNPGLVDYVDSSLLVVPWKDAKAVLREEENAASLKRHNEEQGYKRDDPIDNALSTVFSTTGDHDLDFDQGSLNGTLEAIDRLRARLGLPLGAHIPYSYTDRSGTLHLPFEEALSLAKKFCAVEPAAVLTSVERRGEHRAEMVPGHSARRRLPRRTPQRVPGLPRHHQAVDRA